MTSQISRIYAPFVAASILFFGAIAGFAQDSAIAPTAIRARPQGLWVTDYGFVSVYQGLKLTRSGTPIPSFGFKSAGLFKDPIGLAFDKSNNLWFIDFGTAAVFELSRAQLSALAGGKPIRKPQVTLSTASSSANSLPYAITFDSSGDLWVNDVGLEQISKFTPDQLKKSGNPTPVITISTTDIPLGRLRFDNAGRLWVVGNNILELTAAQLAGGGVLAPLLSLTIDAGRNLHPVDLTFDSGGNMWVAEENPLRSGEAIDMVNAADLTATGDVTLAPAITIGPAAISSSDMSIECPAGLAIDDHGDLWLANGCSSFWGDIVKFTPDELSATGNPVPKVVLWSNKHGTNLEGPTSILFGPLAP